MFPSAGKSKGFTLIEVLITAFVVATVTVAITGLGLLSTRSSIRSEEKTTAEAIANTEIELARKLSYEQIQFTPEGLIEKEKTVNQNGRDFFVESFIELIDDPANGTLPEGTELTEENADFKKLLVKVRVNIPDVPEGDQPASTSAVVAATFFANKAFLVICTPGADDQCKNPNGCTPGTPAACPDQSGKFTLDCPATGVCDGEDPFVACPSDGKCPDPGEKPECSDEKDNDGDGKIDFPADPGCDSAEDTSEKDQEEKEKPCSSDSQCEEGQQCTNNQCEPQWCENITLGGGTAEVCSLEGCNDLQDNDGDLGIDVLGRDNDANGRFDDQVDTPADPECEAIARDGGLFIWSGNCVRNNPYSNSDCSGVESGYERAPTTDMCALAKSCGMKRLVHRDCEVAGCEYENACQRNRNCNDHQTCVNADCFDDEDCPQGEQCNNGTCGGRGKCSILKPVCLSGSCFECTAGNAENCRQIRPDRCDPNRNGGQGICDCYYATCVQCKSSRVNVNPNPDPDCNRPGKPYCHFGDCVAQCGNGVDDDKDGRTDFPNDPECTNRDDNTEGPGPAPGPVTQCNDGVDNLDPEDALVDIGDPGCHTDCDVANAGTYDATDNDETDVGPNCGGPPGGPPAPTPTPRTQCNDALDNDGDFAVDLVDPGCFNNPNNNNEAAADPPPPAGPTVKP